MPTGYTQKLMSEGQSFPEFVMICSRAMGAAIMMRDEPLDAPIKKFEPSGFYKRQQEEGSLEVKRLQSMSNEEKVDHGNVLKSERLKGHREWISKEVEQNLRLENMLKDVESWNPPTSDHNGLKSFMIDQISISLSDTEYITKLIDEDQMKSPMDYFIEDLTNASSRVSRGIEEYEKEVQRTNGRNEWFEKLRSSLPK